eukprot:UN4770
MSILCIIIAINMRILMSIFWTYISSNLYANYSHKYENNYAVFVVIYAYILIINMLYLCLYFLAI